jgi:hypothetical protein
MLPEHDRRTFFAALSGAAALTVGATTDASQAPAAPANAIDITWFDAFKGKHKQVFDLGSFDLSVDTPLRQAVTYLAAHQQINKLEPPIDINVVIGISHKSFPMNASDALWDKYTLGEVWNIKDRATGKPAVRNVFVDGPAPGPATVKALQGRGIVFWQCNFALAAIARELAETTGHEAAAITADLRAGLLPGIRLVPAHTWAVGFAQERGFTYEKL